MTNISYHRRELRTYRTIFLIGTWLCSSFLLAQNTTQNVSENNKSVQSETKVLIEEKQDTAVFKFVPKQKMFWADYKENATYIDWFTQTIRQVKPSILSGEMKIRVLGFCSSYDSYKENLAVAKNRSNQVKSYFITNEGLKECHFQTRNSTRQWHNMSDIVVVTYLHSCKKTTTISDKEWENNSLTQNEQATPSEPDVIESSTEAKTVATNETTETQPKQDKPLQHRWAIKSNVAYLLATVANLGAEYRFANHYSIDLSVIYSPYTVARDYRLRFLAFQPELRYWPKASMKGHFFGTHLNIGAFNISVDHENRYQSPNGFYGMGMSYGYMLPLTRCWAAEFTIGLGYVFTKYDTYYNIPNGARYEKGKPYNYWGLTKVGVSVVYRFGK